MTDVVAAESPPTRGRHAAFYSAADQVLSSLSNALLLFSLATVSSVGEFGVEALLVAVLSTWMGFNRGALGTPILLVSNLAIPEIRAESGYAMIGAAATGIPAAVLLIAIGYFTDQPTVALMFALAAPAVFVQDILRFSAISMGRASHAALSDGLWSVLMLILYAAHLAGLILPPQLIVAVWAIGGAAGAILLVTVTRTLPQYRRIFEWWSTYRSARVGFGVVQALNPTSTTLVTFAVTAIAGTVVAGGLRGAATLFGPIAMLVAALPLIIVPRARRAAESPRQQWSLLVKTTLLTSGLTLVITGSLLAVPAELGALVLGDVWRPALKVAPFLGVSSAVGCWTYSVYVLFQTLGMSRISLRMRILQLVLQVGACVAAAQLFGSAFSVAVALASSSTITAALGVLLALRVVAQTPSSEMRATNTQC